MSESTSEPTRRLVWDLPVRVTHWSLLLAVIAAYVTNKLGPSYFTWHVVCGCTILVLVTFRLTWGFVGTRHARFASFLGGPKAVLNYLRGHHGADGQPETVGHNPLGGAGIIVMLSLLLAQALTGLFSNDDITNAGPFYGWVSAVQSKQLTHFHHRIFLFLEIMIGLHVAAVLFYTFVKRVRLIGPMISGYKSANVVPSGQEIHGSRLGIALAILVVLIVILLVVLKVAPPADLDTF